MAAAGAIPASVCWSCEKVKGKRGCPARGGALICSKCCGTKRRVEIHCPSDCPYLDGAHDAKWSSATRQKDEARFLAHFVALPEEQAGFLFFLHHALVTAGAGAPLSDDELDDVLATAEKTFETERKGIVYQHHPESPHLGPVVRWLAQVLRARGDIEVAPPASDEQVSLALGALRRALADHRELRSGERYLDRARRVLEKFIADAPPLELPDDLAQPASNLIVPPGG